jgi:diguanylate cyclase
MKECFFKFSPAIILAFGAGIWLAAYIFYSLTGLNIILIPFIICQVLFFGFCGLIIQKLNQQANTDSLTGVNNRRFFFSKMSETSKIKMPVSLMIIDIDNFKRFNDTYGHSAGDHALKEFADVLKRSTRKMDIVARLGGEEFVVVLPQTSSENAIKIAERIKQTVAAETFYFGSAGEKMTISIGVATTYSPVHVDFFLKRADMALYKAKGLKNAVVAYEQLDAALT